MVTQKERIFSTIWGETPDRLPYAPRIDLWYNANAVKGTLPDKYENMTVDEIARNEGWAIHRIVPEYKKPRKEADNLHRTIGIWSLKESVLNYRLATDIQVGAKQEGDDFIVEYHTPKGSVRTVTSYTEEMRRSGVSQEWVKEHAIKKREDYQVVGYIFDTIELIPDYDDFVSWSNGIGDDGIAATLGGRAASPMHHIQKYFLDDTEFFYHYNDYQKEMRELSECLEKFFNQTLEIIAKSPAEAALWGMSYDEMITYPPYFEKEIVPWLKKASIKLGENNIALISHCDGENAGLIDLIHDSGIHVAEAVCPHPMTKIKIGEYYKKWSDKMTIFGGIPSNILLPEIVTDDEFNDYLEYFFKAVTPGNRLIVGVADSTPPDADFDRLIRIGDRIEKEGRLPL